MRLLLIPAALILAATPGVARNQEVPEATPAGEPVSCLSLRNIRETKVRSDRIIDFVTTGRKVYRNELPHACPRLGFEQRYLHKTTIQSICSNDTITVLQSPGLSQGASCGLGKFQPVTLAGK